MQPKVHQTKDGSTTLYSDAFDQYYHNPNGAASESKYVFFERSGLNQFLDHADSLTVLEVGFGTGLNFLLLLDLIKSNQLSIPVHFYSIEAFPVDPETAQSIDFKEHLEYPDINELLPAIFSDLQPGMNVIKPLDDMDVTLHLFYGPFDDFNPTDLAVDFIFHDPFSPDVNEELWTDATFLRLAEFSKSQTVLSTYCAASKARGAMCASGWFVAKTRGALGKREMTIASQSEDQLSEYKRVNEKRLARRYREGDF